MLEKIDKNDLKLLAELDSNSRQSFTRIGKTIGLSKEVVKYRYDQLLDKGIFSHSYPLIDTYKLGYLIHIVWIKFHNTSREDELSFIEHLKNSSNVGVIVELYGNFDLVFGIWAENVVEFKKRYDKIVGGYSRFVKEQKVTTEINCNYLSLNFIYEKHIKNILIGNELVNSSIDDIDKSVLKELAKNAREPVVKIANTLELNSNTVINRIKKMEKLGIICGYKINIDYNKLNFMQYRIFLNIKKSSEEDIKKYISTIPQVISIMNYIGYSDIDFRIAVKNVKELYEIINSIKREFGDDVLNYESVLFVKAIDVLNFLPL